MTEKEILSGNKAIAEFMGGKFAQKEVYVSIIEECTNVRHKNSWGMWVADGVDWFPVRKLNYRYSWDWLMPVCIKLNIKYICTDINVAYYEVLEKIKSMDSNT